MASRSAPFKLLLISVAAASCGAPPSERATGAVAEDVTASLESGAQAFEHGAWDRLLAEGTRDGLVDYRYFQLHLMELDAYLATLAEVDAASLAPSHLEAVLINAYNALTIRSILSHPGVGSIREIDGVWSRTRHRVAGHDLTLDEIEHNLLRPFFRDPRIHFALNCASVSCAPLPARAFAGEGLDGQLEDVTRLFLSDPSNARLDGDVLILSRYFDWYGGDFVDSDWAPRAESIPLFVARYAPPEIGAAVESGGVTAIRFFDYDWSLNALRPPDAAAGGADAGVMGAAVRWLRLRVASAGVVGPALYGLAYVVGVLLFLPGAPLTIGAGLAFGPLVGTLLVSLASTAGAASAFLIARHLLRGRVEGWIADHERLAAVDRAVENQGWKVVALTRLSPAFPFNLQNYAYGLTGVPFSQYVLASWVAMLPGTLLYVSIGAVGGELADAASGAADGVATTLRLRGLGATVAAVVLGAAAARRELRAIEASIERPAGGSPSGETQAAGSRSQMG